MLKIFLVEDESIVREGLRDNIPWQQYGYKFVGEASDGEMALPLIQKTRPDVLLTDIRMPFMDGLSLSRIVHQEFPETKIIIISGYDDFEYARQAISLGIVKVNIATASFNCLTKKASSYMKTEGPHNYFALSEAMVAGVYENVMHHIEVFNCA